MTHDSTMTHSLWPVQLISLNNYLNIFSSKFNMNCYVVIISLVDIMFHYFEDNI